MLVDGVIEEVEEEDVEGVNPLFVASNKKFRIESIQDFIKTVKQGFWCWYYDLNQHFITYQSSRNTGSFSGSGLS